MRDTIFALVTAPGRAAVAVLRVSGPHTGDILRQICVQPPKAREAALRKILSADGEIIDEGLVLWFPAPKSFTGEDVFELQLHGGRAIISKVIDRLAALGARPAEAGEFTRRAFEAGRLELTEAEAVADLVDAETDAQRRQALRQLNGELGARSERWRSVLIDALAHLGAQIDFPDDDLPKDIDARPLAAIKALASEIRGALGEVRGERIRDGFKIALIGSPNAGKSSLLNALTGRDAAIVTDFPGTTRDVIEAPIVIQGYKVLLADTAGICHAGDPIEVEGVRRARVWAMEADVRLLLIDPYQTFISADFEALVKEGDALVITKSDKGEFDFSADEYFHNTGNLNVVISSSVSLHGLEPLKSYLNRRVVEGLSGEDFPPITRTRHRILLSEALSHLDRGCALDLGGAELFTEDIRLAARALESFTGRVDSEAVLDRVFSTFCIGK